MPSLQGGSMEKINMIKQQMKKQDAADRRQKEHVLSCTIKAIKEQLKTQQSVTLNVHFNKREIEVLEQEFEVHQSTPQKFRFEDKSVL